MYFIAYIDYFQESMHVIVNNSPVNIRTQKLRYKNSKCSVYYFFFFFTVNCYVEMTYKDHINFFHRFKF